MPLIKLLSAKKLAKGCQPFEGSAAGPQKITKTLSFGQNLFSRGDFPTPKKDLFLNKIDEKFNKSPKSSESSHSNTVLKPTIFSPVLINAKNQSNGMELQYKLVAESEADLKTGKISVTSPIGKGLLGKKVGEVAEVQAPNGTMKFKVDNITV